MCEHGHTQCYFVIFKFVISSSERGQMKTLLKPGEIGLSLLVCFFFKPNKSGVISALRIYVLDLKGKKAFSQSDNSKLAKWLDGC